MLDSLPRDGKVLHSTINDDSIHAMRSLIRLNLSICADGFCPECWSRVLPSTLSTEMTLTSRADTSRHHSHAQPKRGWLKSPPMASSRSLQLGLVVVDAVLVAGIRQAGAVAAVGAADHGLLIVKH